jgi:tetratricopeptide (TPR) repeat protein
MIRFQVAVAAGLLMAITLRDRAVADPKPPQGDARRSIGNLRSDKLDEAVRQLAAEVHHRPRDRWHHRTRHDYCPVPLCHVPPWPHLYLYPYSYPPHYREYYYIVPLYVPVEVLYGPWGVRRIVRWDNLNRPRPNVDVDVPPQGADDRADELEEEEPNLRGTNRKAVSLAWKFLGYGDAHFSNGKYSEAYQRYRKAVQAAPQLADAYFRQGYALMANGRYDLAARGLRRGLELNPDWASSGFHSKELYGGNQLAKKAHFDALAKAAKENPHDADLLFLLGVHLHFDGKPDRAAVFFRRAAQLAGGNDAHLRGFLGNDP